MTASELDNDWYGLQFDVRRSIRYHQRRRAFFDQLDQTGNLLSVIFGSAAIYGVLEVNFHTLALVCAALVTIISAVNLVYASSQKARLHHELARRFLALERELLGDETEEAFKRCSAERLSIEADEPPILRVLDALCYNETIQAQGLSDDQKLGTITFWQRFWAPILDYKFERISKPVAQH